MKRASKEFERHLPDLIHSVLKEQLQDVIDVEIDYQYGVAHEVDEE